MKLVKKKMSPKTTMRMRRVKNPKKVPVPGPFCDKPQCYREATLIWTHQGKCIKRRCPVHKGHP